MVQTIQSTQLACYNCHALEGGDNTHRDYLDPADPYVPWVRIVSGPSTLGPGGTGTYVLRGTRGSASAATYAGLQITAVNSVWTHNGTPDRDITVAGTFGWPAAENTYLRLTTTGDTSFSYCPDLCAPGRITHSKFKSLTGDSVDWTFTWTAPSTPGTYEIWAIENILRSRNSSKNAWIDQDTATSGSQPFVITVAVSDTTPPNAPSVTYPTPNSILADSPTVNIQGTASDDAAGGGINTVGVMIRRSSDSWYWNQSTSTWQSTRYENPATVTSPGQINVTWSFSWNRPSQDGGAPTYSITAVARDMNANVGPDSAAVTNVTIDNVAPTGTIAVNGGAAYTNNATVSINNSVTGAAQMRFSNDGTVWSAWEAYNATKIGWALTAGDGTKTVYAQFRDGANTPNTSGNITDTIVLDTTGPTIQTGNVSPLEGATGISTNTNVSATFTETNGMDEGTLVDANVYLTVDGSATHIASIITYDSATKTVTLNPGADLAPTTTYRATITTGVRDVAANALQAQKSWTFTTSSGADTTPPNAPTVSYPTSNSTLTDSPTVNVAGTASDPSPGTGIARVELIIQRSGDNLYWNQDTGTWQVAEYENNAAGFTPGQTSVSWSFAWQRPSQNGGTPTYTIKARAYDGANNFTDSALVTGITIDNVAPTGSFSINNGAATTNNTSVTLNNAVSGATQMRFSNDGVYDTAEENWEAYATTKAWTLTSGDGTKTVHGEFRDAAGNVLQTSDTIVLDTSAISGSISINNGATYTNTTAVTINNSINGASKMCFADTQAGLPPVAACTELYAATKAYTLPTGDGTKTVWGRFVNDAGSFFDVFDDIILDTTATGAPTGLVTTFVGPYSVKLGWNVTAGAVSYRIFDGVTQVGTSTTNSYTHRDLTPNTSHSYTVRAVDVAGNVSAASSPPVNATTSAEPRIDPIGGWWTEYGRNSGDPTDTRALAPTGGDIYSPNTPAGEGTPSPHGDFTTSTNKCKTCHAVHRAETTSFRLLHDSSRQTECNWCHDASTGRSSHRPYGEMALRGLTVRGEHTIGANRIPDSAVNDTANGDPAGDGWGRLPNLGDGTSPPGLNCYYCHSVHGANTLYRNDDPATLTDPEKRWRMAILRNDPAGNGANGGEIVDYAGTAQPYNSTIMSRSSYTGAYFCSDCHNKNPNVGNNNQGSDNTGGGSRLNLTSHPTRGDGYLEIYGTNNSQVSGGLDDCSSCHRASTFTINAVRVPGGPSDFPHQSQGHKLLMDSYVDGDLQGVDTGDPQRPLPAMDQVCLECHDLGPNEGVGKSF